MKTKIPTGWKIPGNEFKLNTSKRIVVIGDVILDEYYIGDITRQSPEAPVPIVTLKDRHIALGGAANVANNLKTLGYNPLLIGVVGADDYDGFFELMDKAGLDKSGIMTLTGYATTTKTRVMGNGQHVCRVDKETVKAISNDIADRIQIPEDAEVVIFSDYAKGVCTPYLVQRIIREFKGISIADPKDDFIKYKGVDIIKPNKKEALAFMPTHTIGESAMKIWSAVAPNSIVITLGSEGCLIFDGIYTTIPPYIVDAVDITGAGDTFTAALAACLVSGLSLQSSAKAANYAASCSITKLGVATVACSDLEEEVRKWQ